MKRMMFLGALVLGVTVCSQSFGFELLDRMLGHKGCASCCEPGCDAGNGCCEPGCDAGNGCCEPACGAGNGCAEPACDAGNGCCEPSCGAGNGCCEPACGAVSTPVEATPAAPTPDASASAKVSGKVVAVSRTVSIK